MTDDKPYTASQDCDQKHCVAVIVALLLAGCGPLDDDGTRQYQLESRIELFRDCMAMAAKLPRQDGDVADVVGECSSQAYYMTNSLALPPDQKP